MGPDGECQWLGQDVNATARGEDEDWDEEELSEDETNEGDEEEIYTEVELGDTGFARMRLAFATGSLVPLFGIGLL